MEGMDDTRDAEQQEIAAHLDGALLVLAPAGSGKTRALADRVAAALARGVAAVRILCITFTNRAASEMRERVGRAAGPLARGLFLCTFHALCAEVLRREHRAVGLPPDFAIVDELDAEEVFHEVGVPRAKGAVGYFVEALGRAKAIGDAADPRLRLGVGPEELLGGAPAGFRPRLVAYQRLLAERAAVDFDDLVRLTRALFRDDAAAAARWAGAFDLVQVDEVQDTHGSEYEVVRHLARRTGNLACIGDPDQTIYGWRGSDPDAILARFARDFAPVHEVRLRFNYRATRRLVALAAAFAATIPDRRTEIAPAPGLEAGEEPALHVAEDPAAEAAWVAEAVRRAAALHGVPLGRVGVLARTNARARVASEALGHAGLPHVTVEEYDFFRRQEVKDAIALLRALSRPDDAWAAERLLRRPARGMGDAALRRFRERGVPAGLRLADLLSAEAHRAGEPLAPLAEALARGTLVALDVETTGLDAARDEVLEVGAVRLEAGALAAEYRALVRPTVAIGPSEAVHGLSEDLLAREGRDAAEVFAELARFLGGARIVGHNVGFDLRMLEAHGARVGAALAFGAADDTLRLSRRAFPGEARHDLRSVAERLGLPLERAHGALEDARTAARLAARLALELAPGAAARREALAAASPGVRDLAAAIEGLRPKTRTLRPAGALSLALDAVGLSAFYAREPTRAANLATLGSILLRWDEPALAPADALRTAVERATLARHVAAEVAEEGRVAVVTVHQAKGLEFDDIYRAHRGGLAGRDAAAGRAEIGPGRLVLARAVERAAVGALQARRPDRPLHANVEFYTAVLLDAVGLTRELFTPTFAVARVLGWCAHVEEQRASGRLVLPASRYVGPPPS